jgi:hypothetical protein
METQLSKLKQFMANGNYRSALKLAASFGRLGSHKAAIERGWAAITYPAFYVGLGQNPDALVATGLAAIRERYGW